MSRSRRDGTWPTAYDRLDLCATKDLISALQRRFAAKGDEFALFARTRRVNRTETFFVDRGTPGTALRTWWARDKVPANRGDWIHINEDGQWMSCLIGEDIEKDTPDE